MGIGPIRRPAIPAAPARPAGGVERALTGGVRSYFERASSTTPIYAPAQLQPGDCIAGPAIVEEFGSTTVVFPVACGQRRRLRQPALEAPDDGPASIDPIVLEIVEGTLASAEAEVEAAIERTARSPMIREARDFRGGIHDRHCRKLTGRSYSALVQPIVRDFPIETIAARRRLLPQRRLPVRRRHRPPARPVRHRARPPRRARSSPSCRRSATTTTSAAACPARCPATARRTTRKG